ncbi:hypothetical protein [Aliihoeflea sp. 40Bstr573]|uniref:hypothetical protein n=1 Tax=Aliihoeflea sp. 40Bstr573 TaxID=2696467 RepID=UPI002094E93F|nr:hypothetical protein [Aliihoeflea sp. 40Bstr573]MCO6387938.1 hypothetical protein [Aliihoeflea sp. 40Bstr573]
MIAHPHVDVAAKRLGVGRLGAIALFSGKYRAVRCFAVVGKPLDLEPALGGKASKKGGIDVHAALRF